MRPPSIQQFNARLYSQISKDQKKRNLCRRLICLKVDSFLLILIAYTSKRGREKASVCVYIYTNEGEIDI